jgi:hypothetical protein
MQNSLFYRSADIENSIYRRQRFKIRHEGTPRIFGKSLINLVNYFSLRVKDSFAIQLRVGSLGLLQ